MMARSFAGVVMGLRRRQILRLAAGAAAVAALPRLAWAQAYPTGPVRIVVGFPAGTSADTFARLMAQWLADRLGRPFVVENRPGAGSNIAAETVAAAAPDGQTLLWLTAANATNVTFYEKMRFNFTRDIAPVAAIARTVFVMVVNPSLPAKTVPEFIAYAKANPGKINMASGGSGTGIHLYGELFKMMTGTDMVQVQYRGDAPALLDVIAGRAQVMFAGSTALEHIRAGKLRPLAVTTAERWDALPGVPAVGDFVPGYEASGWQALGAPKATPAAVIDTLNREVNAGLADPKLKARYTELGVTLLGGSPADLAKLIAEDIEKWAKVIRAAGITAE
jgi:tripartite-type tricarboxylate transporter receptor subunit TctC